MAVVETKLGAMNPALYQELLEMSEGAEGLLESDLGMARDSFIAEVELRDGFVYKARNGKLKIWWKDDD